MGFLEDRRPEEPGPGKICSVITGIVKENWDDKHQGMVRVEYFLGEAGKNVSGWIPVMTAYAGKGYGMYQLPEVGDEVVIAFQMGDRNCPIVIGSLWSQKNTLPAGTPNKENSVKRFRTKGGCQILISEEKDKEKLTITTPGALTISMDDEKQVISIGDKNKKNQVEIDGKNGTISLSAEKKLSVKVDGKEVLSAGKGTVSLKADSIAVEAGQSLKLKGQSCKIQGASAELKGDSAVKLESGGIMQVKGSMVKIN